MKKIAFLLTATLIAGSAMAGGSLFKNKHKTANTNGVYAIGVHICSNLECPPVRIVEGKCDGAHKTKHWGVCVCDKGYVAKGSNCVACPDGQFSDGIHECTDCEAGTYHASVNDTTCSPCPSGSYCVNGKAYECPEHAICSDTGFECFTGFTTTTTACTCASEKYIDGDTCKKCPEHASCDGNTFTCGDGFEPEGGECIEIIDERDVGSCSNGNVYLSYMPDPCAEDTPMLGKTCTSDNYCPGNNPYEEINTGCCDTTLGKCKSYISRYDEGTYKNVYMCPVENRSCKKNSDCNSGEFCNLVAIKWDYKPDTGTCTPIGEVNTHTYINGTNKTFTISPNYISWWGAENWCKAQGKSLISYTSLQNLFECDKSSYIPVIGHTCNWAKFTTADYWQDGKTLTDYYWTSESYDSSSAWSVYVKNYFLTDHRDNGGRALCEDEPYTPPECPTNCVCDSSGNITAPDGYYKDSATTCTACPDPNATACDDTGKSTDCADGYYMGDTECVANDKCSDGSTPEIGTYRDGECCSVLHTVIKYCPGDDPLPTCTPAASCANDESTCTGSYAKVKNTSYGSAEICCSTGEAKCADWGDRPTPCTCVPEGASDTQWTCNDSLCATCATGEIAKCSDWNDCICLPEDTAEQGTCNGVKCTICEENEIAMCHDGGDPFRNACICVSKDTPDQGTCSEFGCIKCNTGEIAKCFDVPSIFEAKCVCVPEGAPDTQWGCDEYTCVACKTNEVVQCRSGGCICVPENTPDTQWKCSDTQCVICDTDEVAKCLGNNCTCVPEGTPDEQWSCNGIRCITCATGEVAKCSSSGWDNNACICVPSGTPDDQWTCVGGACKVCATGEVAKCSTNGSDDNACTCVPSGASDDQWACGYFACRTCATGEVAQCSTNGSDDNACTCVPSGTPDDQWACGNQVCRTCATGEVAKCSNGSYGNVCTCVPSGDVSDETKWKCNDIECIYCPTGTATCKGYWGRCSCT